MTWEDFKRCVRTETGLDMEALDVAFLEPLKDLKAWYERQSSDTKRYVDFLTKGLGAATLKGFIAKAVGQSVSALEDAAILALVAVFVGIALGVFVDVLGRCGIHAVVA